MPSLKTARIRWARSFTLACGLIGLLAPIGLAIAGEPTGVRDPIHRYNSQSTQDSFAHFKTELEAGRATLEVENELSLLRSLLHALDVPVSSQMLVTSASSFQKTIISPRRPRALYFNDDTYIGFVPGGQIEVVSIDPERGGVFYIFNRLEPGKAPRIRRSENCLTCHATPEMGEIPQLVVESIVPGMSGGGEKAFRRGLSGHGVPLDQRFGGWLITNAPEFSRHWGNLLIEWTKNGVLEKPMKAGELFDLRRYPTSTSDLLPQLLHEHQVGFVNRAVEATYRTRSLLHENPNGGEVVDRELEKTARGLVRYLLFADEAPLPPGGVKGSEAFKVDFLARRKVASDGRSLRDLELNSRMMRYRCSYMIESKAFAGLPPQLKQAVDRELEKALDPTSPAPDYAYLPIEEKQAIRTILRETVPRLNDAVR